MACRVGITTDPERREKEWRAQYPNLIWKVVAGPTSRLEAQLMENWIAIEHGCKAHPGGDEPDDNSENWYVYSFTY